MVDPIGILMRDGFAYVPLPEHEQEEPPGLQGPILLSPRERRDGKGLAPTFTYQGYDVGFGIVAEANPEKCGGQSPCMVRVAGRSENVATVLADATVLTLITDSSDAAASPPDEWFAGITEWLVRNGLPEQRTRTFLSGLHEKTRGEAVFALREFFRKV